MWGGDNKPLPPACLPGWRGGNVAGRQGLQEGDVITHVNNVATATVQDFRTAMGRALGAGRNFALVRIQRSEHEVAFVTLPSKLQ